MNRFFAYLSLLLFLLASSCATPKAPQWKPLTAQELGRKLALEDCLRLARQSNLRQSQWQARLETARAELTAARTLPNPTFSASWEDLGIKDAEGTRLANSTYGLSYPIFFWWTRPKEIAVARRTLVAEQRGVANEQRLLAIEIGTAYFTLLASERKDRAMDALLAEARAALRLAEESFKLGAVSGHDVDLARTEVTQAEAELFDTRRETRAQRLAFAFALGADRPLAVSITETTFTLPRELAPPVTTATLAETVPPALIERALRSDPVYAKARASREAEEAALQLEYRRILPLSEAQGGAARKHDPEGMGHNLSFEIPIPLFNWNQGAIKKARAQLLTAQAEEEQARREAVSGLSEAWETYRTAHVRGTQYSGKITQARTRLALDAQELFASGQMSYTDLLQARREWRQAELAAVDAWSEEMIASWKILCRIGESR